MNFVEVMRKRGSLPAVPVSKPSAPRWKIPAPVVIGKAQAPKPIAVSGPSDEIKALVAEIHAAVTSRKSTAKAIREPVTRLHEIVNG